ncbi:hypothetical protein [Nocardioides sp. HB32]
MGLFKKAKGALGGVDQHLIETGVLARGNVKDVDTTSMSTGRAEQGLGARIVCKVTVEVVPLDGSDSYTAICTHPVPQVYLPKLMERGAAVAVRVDPDDPQDIALDLEHEVPPAPILLQSDDGTSGVVTTNKGTYTYEEIIRDGRPCTVEVSAVFPLGQLTQAGLPASGLILQVHRDGAAPYQAQVGLHVPDELASVVVPGAQLPGKWLPGPGLPTDVNLVTIDFPALGG